MLVCCLVLVASTSLVCGLRSGQRGHLAIEARSVAREGPPTKPDHFRSVDELNKYLADLTEYYTVLGRPRFGKRQEESSDLENSLLSSSSEYGRLRFRREVSATRERRLSNKRQ